MNDPMVIREHHWFESEAQKELRDARLEAGFAKHASPFSTLIAAMGANWKSQEHLSAVLEMGNHNAAQGYRTTFYEEPDRCYQPYDALGSMRNAAYMKAIQEGFEYILYVDNDVLPEPDALDKLLRRGMPIIAPLLDFGVPKLGDINQSDRSKQGKGLSLVGSVLLSFLLIRTSVFLPWALIPFWENAIGATEPYHFQRLSMTGQRPFLDTDVTVKVSESPHFPMDNRPQDGKKGLSWKQAQNQTSPKISRISKLSKL